MSEPHHNTPDRDDARSRDRQLGAAVASGNKQRRLTHCAEQNHFDHVSTQPRLRAQSILARPLSHPYEERRHTVIFSFFATLWHGSTLHFPLLYGGSYPPLDTVRKMIDCFDLLCPEDATFCSRGATANAWRPTGRRSTNVGWSDGGLCLLPSPAAPPDHDPPLSEGTPDYEVLAVRWAYPLFAGFLRLALHLSASVAQEALGQIRTVVQSVDARLADGRSTSSRPFLVVGYGFCKRLGASGISQWIWRPLPSFAEMPPPCSL